MNNYEILSTSKIELVSIKIDNGDGSFTNTTVPVFDSYTDEETTKQIEYKVKIITNGE